MIFLVELENFRDLEDLRNLGDVKNLGNLMVLGNLVVLGNRAVLGSLVVLGPCGHGTLWTSGTFVTTCQTYFSKPFELMNWCGSTYMVVRLSDISSKTGKKCIFLCF